MTNNEPHMELPRYLDSKTDRLARELHEEGERTGPPVSRTPGDPNYEGAEIETRPQTALKHWADRAMWQAPEHDDPQHPKVFIEMVTPDPLGVMAMINGQYTGKFYTSPDQVSDVERREAWEAGAVSQLSLAPLEWVQLSIGFENVTRAFTHQLVRTRMGGYAQESQRFAVKGDLTEAVKLPPSLAHTRGGQPYGAEDSRDEWARNVWDAAVHEVDQAVAHLIDAGYPAEDARGLLPTNILTRIHMHVDMGTLLKLAGSRLCTQAQFEWREVFAQLAQALRTYGTSHHVEESDRWQYELMASRFRPVCFAANRCVMKAKSDRYCSIREQVDEFERQGIPSSQWEQGVGTRSKRNPGQVYTTNGKRIIDPIRPEQWLADPTAARLAP